MEKKRTKGEEGNTEGVESCDFKWGSQKGFMEKIFKQRPDLVRKQSRGYLGRDHSNESKELESTLLVSFYFASFLSSGTGDGIEVLSNLEMLTVNGILCPGLFHHPLLLTLSFFTGPHSDTPDVNCAEDQQLSLLLLGGDREKGLGNQLRKEIQSQCFSLLKSCLLQCLTSEGTISGLKCHAGDNREKKPSNNNNNKITNNSIPSIAYILKLNGYSNS